MQIIFHIWTTFEFIYMLILNLSFFVMKMIVILLFANSNNFLVPNGCKTNNDERKVSIMNERWLLITSLTKDFLVLFEILWKMSFNSVYPHDYITSECKKFHVHNMNRCGYIIIKNIITSLIHIINKSKKYFWKLINVLSKIY